MCGQSVCVRPGPEDGPLGLPRRPLVRATVPMVILALAVRQEGSGDLLRQTLQTRMQVSTQEHHRAP